MACVADALGLSADALAQTHAEARDASIRRQHLAPPAPPHPWVERSEARRILVAARADPPRAVTIAGPPGIGKTGLARHVAAALRGDIADGVLWLAASREQRPVDTVDSLLRIAEALGFRSRLPPWGRDDPTAWACSFRDALCDYRCLIILDDVLDDQLLDALVGDPADAVARPALLVTTHLAHLAHPIDANAEVVTLGGLDAQRTRHILADYLAPERLTDAGVAALHRVLDGVPRSIHIAGALLRAERLTRLSDYATRIEHDPNSADLPLALRTQANGLMASFAQIKSHVTPIAWTLLGHLAVFGDAPFDVEWAQAAAEMEAAQVRRALSGLIEVFLVQELPDDLYRLESHVPMFARGLSGSRVETLRRLAAHVRARDGRVAGGPNERALWAEIVTALVVYTCNADELAVWTGTPPHPRAALDTAAVLADLVSDLVPYLARESVVDGGTWLAAAAASALSLDRREQVGHLLLALGRFWLRMHVRIDAAIAWFDAAAEHLIAAGEWAGASAATSESGRALIACQRPIEGVQRFDRAIAYAREVFADGAELACRLNSAAVSFTRQPDRAGWEHAATLLEQARAACRGDEPATALLDVLCAFNLAAVRAVLGSPAPSGDLDAAWARWSTIELDAPLLEARLILTRLHLSSRADPERLARARALWQTPLIACREPLEDLLWQVGEAAFYTRLYRAAQAAPGGPESPIIAAGWAVSDVSRELHLDSADDLVPLGLMVPVPPLCELFDAAYIATASELAERVFGPENRVLAELTGLPELLG